MEYKPADFLEQDAHKSDPPRDCGLVILNQPIASFEVFKRLWKHADYRLCADGGANRLFERFIDSLESQRANFCPNVIHGDLDSLRDDVRDYYASKGVRISHDPDQYSTDFGKATKMLSAAASSQEQDILILGTIAGRVDQGLGLLHEMLRETRKNPSAKLWLFSESSVSFVLAKGRNTIHTRLAEYYLTKYCGVIPIYGPATISTSGLEWDVRDWYTSMGGQVSTSNHVVAETVVIDTTDKVLFTIALAPRMPD